MHSSTEDQARREYDDWQRQRAMHVALLVAGVVIVYFAYGALFPDLAQRKPAAPAFYWPEPTPYVSHTEVNIFSGNKLCIGQNVSC